MIIIGFSFELHVINKLICIVVLRSSILFHENNRILDALQFIFRSANDTRTNHLRTNNSMKFGFRLQSFYSRRTVLLITALFAQFFIARSKGYFYIN